MERGICQILDAGTRVQSLTSPDGRTWSAVAPSADVHDHAEVRDHAAGGWGLLRLGVRRPMGEMTGPRTGPERHDPRTDDVILLTRLNGQPFALNPDLLERAEATPDTVLTLVDGSKFVVSDTLPEVVRAVEEFRARVVSRAHEMSADTELRAVDAPVADTVPLHGRKKR
jgi:flagellar protein FlbD